MHALRPDETEPSGSRLLQVLYLRAWTLTLASLPLNSVIICLISDDARDLGGRGAMAPTGVSALLVHSALLAAAAGLLAAGARVSAALAGLGALVCALALYTTAIASDWLVAMLGLFANGSIAMALYRAVFLRPHAPRLRVRGLRSDPTQWALLQSAANWMALLTFVLATIAIGYDLVRSLWVSLPVSALAAGSVALSMAVGGAHRFTRRPAGQGLQWLALLVVPLVFGDSAWFLGLAALRQGLVLWRVGFSDAFVQDATDHLLRHPARLLSVSFAAAIVAGAFVLTFPGSNAGEPVTPVDALFTATSAVCVTGLIVRDTATQWTPLGQGIILLLIQVGGLGVMTISVFAAVLVGRRLRLSELGALEHLLPRQESVAARRTVGFIVLATLTIEAAGAALLLIGMHPAGAGGARRLWLASFHSVSAFCNAGFALQSDSLVSYATSGLTIGTVAALIVLGGLGFTVLMTGAAWLRRGRARRVPVHTRLALWGTALLVLVGAAAYAALEWERSLGDLPGGWRPLSALFQSITLRTAGFNTVDLGRIGDGTLLMMLLWMLVGGCPGSTAGGVKVTSVAVLLLAVRSIASGGTQPAFAGRAIPQSTVYRAAAIVTVSLVAVCLGAFLLLVTQQLPSRQLVFEAVSAFGTVGLSLGATPRLDTFGKLVVIGLMFAGRVGPLTLALLLGRGTPPRKQLPDEDVLVG